MRFLLISMMFLSFSSHAQCPAGIPSGGNPACVPPDVYYSTPAGQDAPPLPSPKWQSRWGAIAAGDGGLGVSVNMTKKRAAEKAAIKQCQESSSGSCSIIVAYKNQCAAVAWGDDSHSGWGRAGDLDVARKAALSACSETGKNCKIFYAECSYPVRVR